MTRWQRLGGGAATVVAVATLSQCGPSPDAAADGAMAGAADALPSVESSTAGPRIDGGAPHPDNKCTADPMAGFGTEWDWLNFYASVNRGTNATTLVNLNDIYRRTCNGAPGGFPCNGQPTPFSGLVNSATALSTGPSPSFTPAVAAKFINTGNLAGVNH